MISLRIVILTSCLALGWAAAPSKMPKGWKTCKRSDKNMNVCLQSAVQNAVVSLKNGNQGLGVLPLEPMHFNTLGIDQGSGPVSIKLDFMNLDIHGISTVKVQKFKAEWHNYFLEADVTFNKNVVLLGDYKINGKVLVLPIVGNGKCNLTFENFSAHLSVKGHEQIKNKMKHMQVDKFAVDIDTTRLHIYLENLFNGDKALGSNMNVFLNENWREILNELKPAISRGFGEGFRQVANIVFGKIPLDVIAPK